MMGQRSLMVAMVFCVTLAFLPVSTWALCEQADLEGTWSTQVWGGCPSGTQCWDQCTLTIGSGGSIQAGGTYIDCLGVSSQITGGGLTISSDCRIQGTIQTSNGPVTVESGAIVGQGTLCLGKE